MTEEPELKDNLCQVIFHCYELSGNNECVHHKNKKRCKYFDDYTCLNTIAQVQAISRYLKHIGLEFTLKGVESAKE